MAEERIEKTQERRLRLLRNLRAHFSYEWIPKEMCSRTNGGRFWLRGGRDLPQRLLADLAPTLSSGTSPGRPFTRSYVVSWQVEPSASL